MKKIYFFLAIAICAVFVFGGTQVNAATPATKLKGQVLIQTESKGEVWYVNPIDSKLYFLNSTDALNKFIQKFALKKRSGVIAKTKTFPPNLLGKFLVDENNLAYYISPKDKMAYSLGTLEELFANFKNFGKLVSNKTLEAIPEADGVGNTEDIWNAYGRYRIATQERNFDALQAMAYTKLDFKKDCGTMEKEECKTMFLDLLTQGLNTEPRINRETSVVYKDNRQAIIFSATAKETDESFHLLNQQMAMFVKNKIGEWKLLKIGYNSKARFKMDEETTTDVEAIYKEMEAQLVDQDHDGLTDYVEQGKDFFDKTKTNYLVADTDKDGWWDGIEVAAKKKPLNKWNKLFY
jgi:hypothetical protein